MRRLLSLASVVLVATAVGCVTYTQDLDRARAHYDQNQFEAALAVFRVLENDLDSFNAAEQAKYSYLRGMTDYRLSSLTPAGSNVSDPKRSFRANARHWLAIASAIEKQTPGGLNGDEKNRLNETLADLNKDVYGGADSVEAGGDDKAKDKDKVEDKGEKP